MNSALKFVSIPLTWKVSNLQPTQSETDNEAQLSWQDENIFVVPCFNNIIHQHTTPNIKIMFHFIKQKRCIWISRHALSQASLYRKPTKISGRMEIGPRRGNMAPRLDPFFHNDDLMHGRWHQDHSQSHCRWHLFQLQTPCWFGKPTLHCSPETLLFVKTNSTTFSSLALMLSDELWFWLRHLNTGRRTPELHTKNVRFLAFWLRCSSLARHEVAARPLWIQLSLAFVSTTNPSLIWQTNI